MLRHIGYTLIEILIVIVIISIVGSIAIITIGHNQNKKLESLTNQIANLILLTEEQAMLQPAVYGLSVSKNKLQFYQFNEKKNNWELSTDNLLGKKNLPKDMEISLQINESNDAEKKQQPEIIISPSGDITPFVIRVGNMNQPHRYQITGTSNGAITAELVHEN